MTEVVDFFILFKFNVKTGIVIMEILFVFCIHKLQILPFKTEFNSVFIIKILYHQNFFIFKIIDNRFFIPQFQIEF